MSADNWTYCPRCSDNFAAECIRLDKEIEARYGTVEMDEFDEFRAEVKAFKERGMVAQFREDYETYLGDDGWVYISYRGFCRECNLSFRFEHQEEVKW